MNSSPATYGKTAVLLHWAVALLIGIALPLGFYMHDLPLSPTKLRYYSYHKWIGITVLMLASVRLAWRLTHRAPQMPVTMSRWERRAAAAAHGVLYLLLFVVPVSGWVMSSAKGFQTVWLGILPLPDLVEKNKELGNLLSQVHTGLNLTLATLVAGHLLAALRHQFVSHDAVLSHMVPFLRKPTLAQASALQESGQSLRKAAVRFGSQAVDPHNS